MTAKRSTVAGEIATRLASISIDARTAAASIPTLLIDYQRAAKVANATADRFAFAVVAAALGFMGEPLPDLLAARTDDHALGARIRTAYDQVLAARSTTP